MSKIARGPGIERALLVGTKTKVDQMRVALPDSVPPWRLARTTRPRPRATKRPHHRRTVWKSEPREGEGSEVRENPELTKQFPEGGCGLE